MFWVVWDCFDSFRWVLVCLIMLPGCFLVICLVLAEWVCLDFLGLSVVRFFVAYLCYMYDALFIFL